MPFRALVQTSDTFNTWLAATNETIDYVSNTQVFLVAQASATPSAATGNAALSGVLTVSGLRANTNVIFSGANVYINASAVTVTSPTTISGTATLTNTLTAEGPVVVRGASLTVNGAAVTVFTGTGTLTSNVATTIANTFAVTGASSFTSTLSVTGAANALSTLGVTGAVVLANTLAVTGATTLSNTLAVTGAATLSTVNVTSTMNVAGNLTVSANVTIGNTTATTGYLTVKQTAAFQNTISFAGLATASAGIAVSGGSLTVGTLTVNSTGFVTAGTWQGSVIATAYTAAKVVTVNGQSPDGAGNVTLSSGSVSGVVELAGAQTVTGRKSFNASLSSGAMATATASLGAVEVVSSGANAAYLSFLRSGSYGIYLGLDTDNVLKVGGWSAGAVAHTILHSGNYTTFSPSTTGAGASGSSWNISILGNANNANYATSAGSATTAGSAGSATTSATQAVSVNDTTIATTAFVKNVLANATYGTIAGNAATATTLQTARTINGQSFNGSANITIPASGIPAGSFASGTYTFPGQVSIPVGAASAPSLTIANGSGTNAGLYTSTDAVEFGARFDVASSQSIVRAFHGLPKVDFIVGGTIPLTLEASSVKVDGSFRTRSGPGIAMFPQTNGDTYIGEWDGTTNLAYSTIHLISSPTLHSDMRVKNVLSPTIPDALAIVDRVHPFIYSHKQYMQGDVKPGFAAQQIRREIDAVLGTTLVIGDMSMALYMDQMLPILWAAVQRLSAEVRRLKGDSVSLDPVPVPAEYLALSTETVSPSSSAPLSLSKRTRKKRTE